MMTNFKERLKETDERMSYLKRNNPLLATDVFKRYKQLLDRHKAKLAEHEFDSSDQDSNSCSGNFSKGDNPENELLDKKSAELKEIEIEMEKYESEDCKEFMRLVIERKHLVKKLGLNLNKEKTPPNENSIFSLKPSDGSNGRALEKVTILDNIIKNLDSEWSKNLCEKFNLEVIKKTDMVQFVDKGDKTIIEVNKHSVSVQGLPNDYAKIVDAMIEIYLKGIEGKSPIFSHVVKHQDSSVQQRVEYKLAVALKNNGIASDKINGKLIGEILNPTKSNADDLVNKDTMEKSTSHRVSQGGN